MKHKNLLFCMMILLLLTLSPAALAAQSGSLEVQDIDDPVCLYRLTNGSGRVTEDFAGADITIPGEDPVATAKQLQSYAKQHNLTGKTARPTRGTAAFSPLEEGIYLVASLGQPEEFDPFLVGIPTVINGEKVYHIEAKPKQEEEETQSTTAPTEPENTDTAIPQTGTSVIPQYTLLVLGSLLTLAGLFQVIRGREDCHE